MARDLEKQVATESKASRRNASRYSVLGMLSMKPMSGYEIRKMMGESVHHFWSESYGQIYPTLKQLAADGLIAPRPTARAAAKQTRGSNRQVYELTAAGRRTLRTWLEQAPRMQPPRHELLLKLFFGAEGELAVQQRQLEEVRDHRRQQMKLYESIVAELKRNHASVPALPYWLITLDLGISQARTVIEWCDRTMTELARLGHSNRGSR